MAARSTQSTIPLGSQTTRNLWLPTPAVNLPRQVQLILDPEYNIVFFLILALVCSDSQSCKYMELDQTTIKTDSTIKVTAVSKVLRHQHLKFLSAQ